MTCTGMAFFPTNFMLQISHDQEDDHHAPISSPLITPLNLPPCSSTQDFHGVSSFLGKRSSMSFSGIMNADVVADINNCEDQTTNLMNGDPDHDELSDDGSQAGEKKRRLNMEQVKTLERNFELGNKLEPERKMQLARALGLQPRQIAIWFQNRRARWKTKQLEKDYDLLKRQFEAIKAENDSLQSQNQKLHSEILALKTREPTESINLNKETEGSSSNRSENSSEIKLDISRTPAIDSPIMSNNNHHHHHHDHHNHQAIPNSRNLFPTSNNNSNININTGIRPNATTAVAQQLFHSSLTRPEHHHHHHHHHHQTAATTVKEESFSNMFCGIEDQPGFWPWLEQQHFN